MASIFISYSHYDKEHAKKIMELLQKMNLKVFLDEKDIRWGDNITDTIENVLSNEITHEIVILSPGSMKSQWVSYEVGYAKAKGIAILPFLTHLALDIPSFLANYNYVTELEQIEKYLFKNINMTRLINVDGKEEYVEIITSFLFNDNKREYMVYTKNEIDEYGNIMVYISRVIREDNGSALCTKVKECDWDRIKNVLKEMANEGLGEYAKKRLSGITYYDSEGVEII